VQYPLYSGEEKAGNFTIESTDACFVLAVPRFASSRKGTNDENTQLQPYRPPGPDRRTT